MGFQVPTEAEQRQMRAMEEVGKRRATEGTLWFVLAWPLAAGGLMAFLGMGLILAMFLGAGIAGAVSKVVLANRSKAIVAAVAAAHGLRPEDLQAERYLID